MKKCLALLFVVALFMVEAHADEINLAPGKKQTIRLDQAYSSSEHQNKAVAYTSGRGSRDVTIHAKRAGSTDIKLYAKDGQLIRDLQVTVGKKLAAATVAPQTFAAMEPLEVTKEEVVISDLKAKTKNKKVEKVAEPSPTYDAWRTLRGLFPKENVNIQVVGNSLALGGSVSDAATAAQIVQVASQLSGGRPVINMMQIKSGQQVMLRVRIGEVQRGAMDQLGLSVQGVVGAVSGLFYSSKMYDISTRLDYLSQNGLMKVLAEPNLTAISGEKATFLAGGEFPIPVTQKDGVTTIDYKKFGVGVEFTPTVLSQNRIRLAVEPEVSEIAHGSVKFGDGGKIPMLNTRRAKTTVELAPGESFMIAGLISDNMKDVSSEMPGLGDIPVLGALFRSTAFKRNETELVIAVTPYLVDPVPAQEIKLPTDKLKAASIFEQYFFGAIAHQPTTLQEKSAQPQGTHGFMTE
jgi:Flp pilus assembly secretin CpaC